MESLLRDLQYALRGLSRDRAFTAFCLVTLALGIGANTAMFGIADRLLLGGPDHVRDSTRVVRLYATTKNPGMREFTTDGFGYVTYDLMRQNAHSFSAPRRASVCSTTKEPRSFSTSSMLYGRSIPSNRPTGAATA